MSLAPSPSVLERLLAITLITALVLYSAYALLVGHWWISGLAAPVVALLLAGRHRRARFATYVFLTVALLRTAFTGHWGMALGATGALLLLQTPAACRLWPRLTPPGRMARP
ncbi:MAG TPA: hypothetical protein VID04_10070 [Methylomirabilota bacterium]